jgi:hypothetical protein
MAKTTMSFNQLDQLCNDISKQSNESPAFYFFNKARIARFHLDNKKQLDTLNRKCKHLVKLYVMHDGDGKPMTEIDGNQETVFVFASAVEKALYLKDLTAFMKRAIEIDI